MQAFFFHFPFFVVVVKKAVMVPGVPSDYVHSNSQSNLAAIRLSLAKAHGFTSRNMAARSGLYSGETAFQKSMPYTLISHTNAYATRGRLTLKDVERFRNEPVHAALSKVISKSNKVLTSSHEIANSNDPNITDNYNTIHETTTTD